MRANFASLLVALYTAIFVAGSPLPQPYRIISPPAPGSWHRVFGFHASQGVSLAVPSSSPDPVVAVNASVTPNTNADTNVAISTTPPLAALHSLGHISGLLSGLLTVVGQSLSGQSPNSASIGTILTTALKDLSTQIGQASSSIPSSGTYPDLASFMNRISDQISVLGSQLSALGNSGLTLPSGTIGTIISGIVSQLPDVVTKIASVSGSDGAAVLSNGQQAIENIRKAAQTFGP
ncbi:hypothetical protein MIND_01254700 [Mycena indigotica]|uniref:Uncharacterized protein n=1 Tax=Mycena indigotica TaxID=2126181 RepID=A0A8H6S309_9AGAR|nr:uncharacterized protein MIND_01254700 [Mycena indigotica]KAF7291116.1 hypothetical protein MIND_01254700 [Mycena indigotica]